MFWNNDYGFVRFCSPFFGNEMEAILSFCENQFQIIRINGSEFVNENKKEIEKLEITEILSLLNHLSHFPTSLLVHKHLRSEVGHSSSPIYT